ncbi:3'-5' exoribonuclease 1 [Geranomyces michiganensis]|nr:3'-5' exoribonuclease 1 [Geranomyces michiganensis]
MNTAKEHEPSPPCSSSPSSESDEAADNNTRTTPSTQPEVEALRRQLQELGLETRGRKAELQKRLRTAKKKQQEAGAQQRLEDLSVVERPNVFEEEEEEGSRPPREQPFDYYLVLDVEATCIETPSGVPFKFGYYPNEIIEFPVVVIDARTLTNAGVFHSYVRPTVNPTLSDFCKNLTGITQETVDAADDFPTVLARFERWMAQFSTYPFANAVFVCDGAFDVRDFLRKQCQHSVINRPPYAIRFVDLRRLYVDFYQRTRTNLAGMLSGLGMEFDGREHCGLDDATNIARIVVRMMKDGCLFACNTQCTLTRRMVTKKGDVVYGKASDMRPKWNSTNSILF